MKTGSYFKTVSQDEVATYFQNVHDDTLVIAIPVFEDRPSLERLLDELSALFGDGLFVILIDDGSVRDPIDAGQLARHSLDGVVLRLARNVGHQRAISVGIAFAALNPHGSDTVVMDSDGEDQPSSILELRAALDNDNFDGAVASRRSRQDNKTFKFGYQAYKKIFRLMTGRRIDYGNFSIFKPLAVRRLAAMHETSLHFAAAAMSSKLRLKSVPQDRGRRYAGRSKMNSLGLMLHGFRAIMVFAEDVMIRLGFLCGLAAVICIAGILLATVLKAAALATPGWFSLALGIMILTLIQIGMFTLLSLLLTGFLKFYPQPRPDSLWLIDEILSGRN